MHHHLEDATSVLNKSSMVPLMRSRKNTAAIIAFAAIEIGLACRGCDPAGYDHADARQKIRPFPRTDWACNGRSGERIVRRSPYRILHLGTDLAGVPADHDGRRCGRLLSR